MKRFTDFLTVLGLLLKLLGWLLLIGVVVTVVGLVLWSVFLS